VVKIQSEVIFLNTVKNVFNDLSFTLDSVQIPIMIRNSFYRCSFCIVRLGMDWCTVQKG